jgi:putative addiction module component (TIGR02574 family)
MKEDPSITIRAAEIEAAALQLSRPERARLAERLIASLDNDGDIALDWAVELERRVREVDSGEEELIPGERVMAEMRLLLRR